VCKASKLAARPDERGASCGTRPLALNGFAEASGLKQSSLCPYPAAQLAKNFANEKSRKIQPSLGGNTYLKNKACNGS